MDIGATAWVSFMDMTNNPPSEIICINISERELQKGMAAEHAYPKTNFQYILMDANNLDFADESFDIVIGGGILHHLDFEKALQGISRVLKKEGFCLFQEPLGCNPIGKIARKLTPKARTADEKPLGKIEIDMLDHYFATKYQFFQLFYVPMGVISAKLFKSPLNFLMKLAFRLDRFLEKNMPMGFRMLYRYVYIYGEKK